MDKEWIDISIMCVFFLTCFNLFNLDGRFSESDQLLLVTYNKVRNITFAIKHKYFQKRKYINLKKKK
jgi:hypothetical protein